jgi:nucleotide-binding universal stress UspA family protein
VHDVGHWPPAAGQRRRRLVRRRVADGDGPDRRVGLRHAERLPERRDPRREDPEEQGAEAGVDGRQQHQQRCHPRVDVPVRDGPERLPLVDHALVRLGVAVEVRLLVGERDDHQGRFEQPRPAERGAGLGVGEGGAPEAGRLLGAIEHEEGPTLAEAGRRRVEGVVEDAVDHVGRDAPAGLEVADHAAAADDILELHARSVAFTTDGPGDSAHHVAMFSSIVVGTDGSTTAEEAVRQATALARTCGAKLHLVSAFKPLEAMYVSPEVMPTGIHALVNPEAEATRVLTEAVGKARAEGIEAEMHACAGDPAGVLIDVAEATKADVIVVGNRGMSGKARFLLGSVPNKVSHHAPCTVMIIRTV